MADNSAAVAEQLRVVPELPRHCLCENLAHCRTGSDMDGTISLVSNVAMLINAERALDDIAFRSDEPDAESVEAEKFPGQLDRAATQLVNGLRPR